MAFTPTLTLPLLSTPDVIYTNLWGECNITAQPSDTDAFGMGINESDNETCIVCERTDLGGLDQCHIIPSSERYTVSPINIPTCHWNSEKKALIVEAYEKVALHSILCQNRHS